MATLSTCGSITGGCGQEVCRGLMFDDNEVKDLYVPRAEETMGIKQGFSGYAVNGTPGEFSLPHHSAHKC